jgi:hypothetical protein
VAPGTAAASLSSSAASTSSFNQRWMVDRGLLQVCDHHNADYPEDKLADGDLDLQ